ncbi:MAG: hypothetical protein JSV83_07460 [Desulfobacterales bacterium]|nr:MAG: hypothetical protein JSV83_07460 [Desulfobacterales bacterium]
MKKRRFIAFFISLSILACMVNHIGSVTILAIEGRVFDKASKVPLENVRAYFIDTGYDDKRSKQAHRFEIGQSDANGKIQVRLNYYWERKESIFHSYPKKTFAIMLAKASYQTRYFHFKESQLEGEKFTYFVQLKDVYLETLQKE